MNRLPYFLGVGILGLTVSAWAEPNPPPPPDRPAQADRPERPPIPEQMLERVFDRLDADGNGSVSKEEFMDRMPQIMERIRQRSAGPGGPGDGRSEPGGVLERRAERGQPFPREGGFGRGPDQLPEEMQRLIDQRVEEAVRRIMRDRGFAQPGGPDRPGIGPQRERRGRGGPAREGPGVRRPQPPQGPGRDDGAPPPDRPPLGGPQPPRQPPPPGPGPGAGRA